MARHTLYRRIALAALSLATALPLGTAAQTGTAPPASARPPLVPVYAPDAALLAAFGGQPGLARISDALVDAVRADARTAAFFKDSKPAPLKGQITDQLCQLLAGPCVYDGDTMKASHADLKIGRADFLAVVELLQAAMAAQGVPFGAQNQLLARLAPMHRDIITR